MNNLIKTNPIYDTIDGIKSFLIDLDSLHTLKDLRRNAGYDRKERLNQYIILGKFVLDSCGNFSIIIKEGTRTVIPSEIVPNLPNIVTYDDVFNYLLPDSSICSTSCWLPPTYVKCSICDEPWSIKNCHDVIKTNTSIHYDLHQFVGQKLSNMKEIPEYIHRYKHYISHESIGSDNYINKDGGNIKGWKHVDKDYVIKSGDKCSVSVYKFTHTECNKLQTIESSLKKFESLFAEAEYSNAILNGIANRYYNSNTYESHSPPWYIAKINGIAPIIIGWRKSVIHIGWEKSRIDLSYLFEEEKVTKEAYMIHAHGYDKAVEYLKKIIPELINKTFEKITMYD